MEIRAYFKYEKDRMNQNLSSETTTRVFLDRLKTELLSDLPGVDAHLLLAPEIRIQDLKTGQTPAHAIESAVLIVLYPFGGRLYTAVILRNEYDGAHSGQISLPGGKKEESDINFEHTALREAQEEIGIIPDDVEIIGQLSRFYVRPSNFIVYPFIAYLPYKPVFQPDAIEVQRVIEIDIFDAIRRDSIVHKILTFKNNIQVNAPGFLVGGEFMWGATAMIFSELMHVLERTTNSIEKTGLANQQF